jgi:Icc protein
MIADHIRIVQISDIHVGPTEDPVQNIDARGNFLKVLDGVRNKAIDLVVLSGDIAADQAEPGAYEWVAKIMKNFPLPWIVMGGNHDKISTMAKYFDLGEDLKNGMLYFKRKIKGHHLFFLDSSTNKIQSEQLAWLKKECSLLEDEEALLFIHHPPAICGCHFMDTKYPLLNIDEVRKTLRSIHNIHNIFVGHYHTEKFIVQDGKNIHLTPSTMMQIDTKTPNFHMEHTRPGWRIIELYNGRLDTEVHYALDTPEASSGPSIF